jgi:hypothetical protein
VVIAIAVAVPALSVLKVIEVTEIDCTAAVHANDVSVELGIAAPVEPAATQDAPAGMLCMVTVFEFRVSPVCGVM